MLTATGRAKSDKDGRQGVFQPTGVPQKQDGDDVGGGGENRGLSRFLIPQGRKTSLKKRIPAEFHRDFWKLGELGAQSTHPVEKQIRCVPGLPNHTTHRAILAQLLAQRPLSTGQQDKGQLDARLAAEICSGRQRMAHENKKPSRAGL